MSLLVFFRSKIIFLREGEVESETYKLRKFFKVSFNERTLDGISRSSAKFLKRE
jgi:hypothetical protein